MCSTPEVYSTKSGTFPGTVRLKFMLGKTITSLNGLVSEGLQHCDSNMFHVWVLFVIIRSLGVLEKIYFPDRLINLSKVAHHLKPR